MTKMTEAQYDAINNDGGEGYNPIRAAREAAECQVVHEVTLDDLYRQIEALDCSSARESGTYDADKVAAIRAQIDDIKSADDAKFLAVWTPEVMQARKDEWNAWARANATKKGLSVSLVDAREKAQGWTCEEMRRAIKLHAGK